MIVWVKILSHYTDSNPGFNDALIFDGFDVRDHPFEGAEQVLVSEREVMK